MNNIIYKRDKNIMTKGYARTLTKLLFNKEIGKLSFPKSLQSKHITDKNILKQHLDNNSLNVMFLSVADVMKLIKYIKNEFNIDVCVGSNSVVYNE